jgi:hypothetical protein
MVIALPLPTTHIGATTTTIRNKSAKQVPEEINQSGEPTTSENTGGPETTPKGHPHRHNSASEEEEEHHHAKRTTVVTKSRKYPQSKKKQ